MLVSEFMSSLLFSLLCTCAIMYPIYFFVEHKINFFKSILVIIYVRQFGIFCESMQLLYDICFSFLDEENLEDQNYFKAFITPLNISRFSKNGYVIMMDKVTHISKTKSTIPIISIYNINNPTRPFVKLDNLKFDYRKEVRQVLYESATWYNIKEIRKFTKLIRKNTGYKINKDNKSIYIKNIIIDGIWAKNEKDAMDKLFSRTISKIKKEAEKFAIVIEKDIKEPEVKNATSGAEQI